jgi:hypothetical protein
VQVVGKGLAARRKIAVTLFVLGAAGVGVWSCFAALEPICSERLDADLTSPDGKHTARLVNKYCNLGFGNASNRRLLTLAAANDSKERSTLVFRAWDKMPEHDLVAIRWTSPNDLLVVVNIQPDFDIPQIDTSFHKVGEVKINYRFEQSPNSD